MTTTQPGNVQALYTVHLVWPIVLLLLMTLFSSTIVAQQTYTDTLFTRGETFAKVLNNSDVVLRDVKHKPEFAGGKTAWQEYLAGSIDLTVPAKKKAPTGVHYASVLFIVGKDGALRNVRAESGCGYGMEDELIKSLNASPRWNPARTSIQEVVSFAARQVVIYTIQGTKVSLKIP